MSLISRTIIGLVSLSAAFLVSSHGIELQESQTPMLFDVSFLLAGGLIAMVAYHFIQAEHLKKEESPSAKASQIKVAAVCNVQYTVIGRFLDHDIYDFLDVTFACGNKLRYKFETVIDNFHKGAPDTSGFQPGALILAPGIVYAPE